jgi:hypothetical protein
MARTTGAGGASPVWRRADGVAYVDSSQRSVALDLDHPDHAPYVFEGSAADIWDLVDGRRSEVELTAELAAAYDAPTEAVGADVHAFLERLAGLGLLVVVDTDTGTAAVTVSAD